MDNPEDVYQAIAHPVRREILDTLSVSKEDAGMPIGELSDRFDISRQAVTRHIRQLESAGLLEIIKDGRQRLCHANPARLAIVYKWISVYQQYWAEKLEDLGSYLDSESSASTSLPSDEAPEFP